MSHRHNNLLDQVKKMCAMHYESPTSLAFTADYVTLTSLFTAWQEEALKQESEITCKSSCASCCDHWVEDVFAFEVAQIAHLILQELPPQLVDHLIEVCQQDEEELIAIVEEDESGDEIALLNRFFLLGRRCPLLMENNQCAFYDLRPLTCRSFFSRREALYCTAEKVYETTPATFMVIPDGEIEDLLEELDQQFRSEDSPTGLRSQLWRELIRQRVL